MKFSDSINNNFYLDEQIRIVLSSYFDSKDISLNNPDKYSFVCNVCKGGTSDKNKHRRRTYILKQRTPYWVYCQNCGYSKSVTTWLKEYYPFEYKQYVKNILKVNQNYTHPIIKPEIILPKKEIITEEEIVNIKSFVPILKGDTKLFKNAIEYCEKRLIPESIWQKWFIALSGTYKNRLIIPYYNKDQIYFYEGRSLLNWMQPKYLSRKGNYNNIGNYYDVDKNKVVTVLEGYIDSLFVENAISLTGLKIDDKKLDEFPNKRFLLDYDTKDVTENAKKKSIRLLETGQYVFCWKLFIKNYKLPKRDKWDVNEAMIYLGRKDKFKIEELDKYFLNSIFSKALYV